MFLNWYPDTRGWGLKRFYLVVATYFFVRLPIVQFSAAASVKQSSKIFQIWGPIRSFGDKTYTNEMPS